MANQESIVEISKREYSEGKTAVAVVLSAALIVIGIGIVSAPSQYHPPITIYWSK